MNISEILQQQAGQRPNQAAIIDTHRGRTRVTTFAELEQLVGRAASLLQQSNLKPGDAVLVFQPMSLELYTALLAIFQLELVAMFLDPSAGRDHIARCCALGAPKALIASSKAHLLRLVSPAMRRIPHKFAIGVGVPGARSWVGIAKQPYQDTDNPAKPESPALLTFTSGSTGLPKAAVRTHGFLMAQHRALEQSLALTPGAVDLATLPIFVLANLGSGLTSVIPDADLRFPGKISPEPVIAQITAHAPTTIGASPAFLDRIADHCLQAGTTLPTFRAIFTGGAPVFPRLLDKLQRVAPQAEIVAVYGSTEAEPIAHIALGDITSTDRTAMRGGGGLLTGKPVDCINLRVINQRWGEPIGPYTDAEFQSQFCNTGLPGEIVVNGDHVLTGYLHGHGDSETKFRVDGAIWHRTGDAGYLDAAGRLWLLGRCAATIEDAHGIAYPFAIETAIHDAAGVARVAAISHGGRRLVIIEPENSSASIDLAALKNTLAWAHINDLIIVKKIPVDKRHNAKVDYPALRKMLDQSNHKAG